MQPSPDLIISWDAWASEARFMEKDVALVMNGALPSKFSFHHRYLSCGWLGRGTANISYDLCEFPPPAAIYRALTMQRSGPWEYVTEPTIVNAEQFAYPVVSRLPFRSIALEDLFGGYMSVQLTADCILAAGHQKCASHSQCYIR
jgi:hypothetical protein